MARAIHKSKMTYKDKIGLINYMADKMGLDASEILHISSTGVLRAANVTLRNGEQVSVDVSAITARLIEEMQGDLTEDSLLNIDELKSLAEKDSKQSYFDLKENGLWSSKIRRPRGDSPQLEADHLVFSLSNAETAMFSSEEKQGELTNSILEAIGNQTKQNFGDGFGRETILQLHKDTDNTHVHVVINRHALNPESKQISTSLDMFENINMKGLTDSINDILLKKGIGIEFDVGSAATATSTKQATEKSERATQQRKLLQDPALLSVIDASSVLQFESIFSDLEAQEKELSKKLDAVAAMRQRATEAFAVYHQLSETKEQVSALTSENESLMRDIEVKDGELISVKTDVEMLTKKVDGLTSKLESKTSDLESMTDRFEQTAQKLSLTSVQLDDETKLKNEALEELELANESVETLESEKVELSKNIVELSEKIVELSEKIEELDESNKALITDKNEVEQELSTVKADLASKDSEIEKLVEQNAELVNKMQEMQSEHMKALAEQQSNFMKQMTEMQASMMQQMQSMMQKPEKVKEEPVKNQVKSAIEIVVNADEIALDDMYSIVDNSLESVNKQYRASNDVDFMYRKGADIYAVENDKVIGHVSDQEPVISFNSLATKIQNARWGLSALTHAVKQSASNLLNNAKVFFGFETATVKAINDDFAKHGVERVVSIETQEQKANRVVFETETDFK